MFWGTIATLSLVITVALCACPTGWEHHRGSCYKFKNGSETWQAAREMCKWHKSDLAAVETKAELTWIRSQARSFNFTKDDEGFWISGSDWENEGSWIWESTGGAFAANAPWGQGQPNNRYGHEDCLAIVHYFDYIYSDEVCDQQRGYICEIKDTVAPVVG